LAAKNTFTKLFRLFFAFLLSSVLITAQVPGDSLDIYEKTKNLVHKIKMWKQDSVKLTQKYKDSTYTDIFDQYNMAIDTLPQNNLKINLSLPIYMGTLTTGLKYIIEKDSVNIQKIKFLSSFALSDSNIIFDDSINIRLNNSLPDRQQIFSFVQNRIDYYRTMLLPSKYSATNLKPIAKPIQLKIFGRDRYDLKYKKTWKWIKTLKTLGKNKRLYSGLVSIKYKSDRTYLSKSYISLTTEYARGHHFFIINESLKKTNNRYISQEYNVKLYPYVRVDNVSNIFSQEKTRTGQKIKVKVK